VTLVTTTSPEPSIANVAFVLAAAIVTVSVPDASTHPVAACAGMAPPITR